MIIPIILVFSWINVVWIYWYRVRPLRLPDVGKSAREWFLNFTGMLFWFGGVMWIFLALDKPLPALVFAALSFAAWLGAWETGMRYWKLQRKAYRAQQQDAE